MVGESAGSEQSERNLCGLVSTEKEADALIMISDSEIDFEFGEHETNMQVGRQLMPPVHGIYNNNQ